MPTLKIVETGKLVLVKAIIWWYNGWEKKGNCGGLWGKLPKAIL
jgi:hypothetical protein